MNKPLSDAELQHRMMKYNAEVVDRIIGLFTPPPRRRGEADDTHRARMEAALQDRLFAALDEVEATIDAINDAKSGSSVMEISKGSFQDWRHDQDIKTRDYWNGKISEAQS